MSVETLPPTAVPPRFEEPVPPISGVRESARARWERLSVAARDSRLTVPVALFGLLLIAAYLRTRQFDFYYWVDEGISVGIAGHPLSQIPHLLRLDGAPPLYYVMLHVWMSLFGRGEISTHAFSLIPGLAIVPVAYWAGASLWDRRAGVFCAALAAGAPYLATYSQETRMYEFVSLVGLVVAASFVHAFVRHRRRYIPLFSVALAAALYSHNWALFLGLASAAAFAVCIWEAPDSERRALLRDGLIGFGGVALLYLPWLPTLLYQSSHTGAPWDLPPVFWSISQSLYALVGGRGAAVALLLGAGAGLLAVRRTSERFAGRFPLDVEVLLALGLGTLAIAFAYSKTTPAWAIRYFAVLVGPLLLVTGYGLSRGRRLGAVALALVAIFWLLDPVASSRSSKSNVAPVVRAMRAQLGSDPLVLSTQPEQVPVIYYYLPHAHFGTPLGPAPDPGVMDWRMALEHLRASSVSRVLEPMLARVQAGRRVLLVIPTNLKPQPLYLNLIARDSKRWLRALNHDPRFRRIRISSAGAPAGVAVEGVLYQRR